MKGVFAMFDQDGSGEIDAREMKKAMQALGMNPTDDDIKNMMIEVDQDGSGEVDFKEFATLMGRKMAE